MMTIINQKIPNQPKEKYYGNREYKLHLLFDKMNTKDNTIDNPFDFNVNTYNIKTDIETKVNPNKLMYLIKNYNLMKINKRATQLLFRLNEGKGKALYMIGVKDNGTAQGITIQPIIESYYYLIQMCKLINANLKTFKIYKTDMDNKYIATCRIDIDIEDDILIF